MDKTPILVANPKAHKTWEETLAWLEAVGPESAAFKGTIIFCPSHPFLSSGAQIIKVKNYSLKLGSQDVSRFEQGAYTGEVAASQIASLVSYAIIGHSERRENLDEDEITLSKKVKNARDANIEPIFCIQDEKTEIPDGVKIVAYEPIFAIGTGNPDSPENVKQIAQRIKSTNNVTFLYGGSVSSANVASFLEPEKVDGVLVGATNSLDPQKFLEIIKSSS